LQVNLHIEGVFVWRDVKHLTSSKKCGAKNIEVQFGKAEVRKLMINLRGGDYKVKDIMDARI
jgi:hypothetical protein